MKPLLFLLPLLLLVVIPLAPHSSQHQTLEDTGFIPVARPSGPVAMGVGDGREFLQIQVDPPSKAVYPPITHYNIYATPVEWINDIEDAGYTWCTTPDYPPDCPASQDYAHPWQLIMNTTKITGDPERVFLVIEKGTGRILDADYGNYTGYDTGISHILPPLAEEGEQQKTLRVEICAHAVNDIDPGVPICSKLRTGPYDPMQ